MHPRGSTQAAGVRARALARSRKRGQATSGLFAAPALADLKAGMGQGQRSDGGNPARRKAPGSGCGAESTHRTLGCARALADFDIKFIAGRAVLAGASACFYPLSCRAPRGASATLCLRKPVPAQTRLLCRLRAPNPWRNFTRLARSNPAIAFDGAGVAPAKWPLAGQRRKAQRGASASQLLTTLASDDPHPQQR